LARTREEMLEELREIRNGEAPKPDLVLMDFILADGYGTEVLRAIKKAILPAMFRYCRDQIFKVKLYTLVKISPFIWVMYQSGYLGITGFSPTIKKSRSHFRLHR